ncbi:dTDP-glucose 4,6-dehydratase [Peptoclostridium litorale DSM 5388]|uniref:dTDP-glucose 4,6-dehydratase n=1 Tax=Peptoclostridium litorale DSM 5388 TaxID=1121324 RepID=A0A069RC29_PEPLI|nr:dTDP-glucose 4,6-dehydratase [Peptoclostridium litorale]KDR94586.1 dTDP-glucose 4,6-dehydratase RfbB [Peptoclostridium litorale DSM 5388]SIO31757.1 dTDP-glucose 4,6-dehydratase [Peptoclostridium litorale DSM 5388]
MKKTILVTGGAGFIGSNFIRHMLRRHTGYNIVNLDVLTYAGNLENLRDIEDSDSYRFIRGDIANEALVDSIFQCGIDMVVNFAAESHVDRSIEDPGAFVRTNVLGTQVLLEASRKHGVSRYLQVSTDEVYGSLGGSGFFTESTPLMPNSPYSASKASADMLARAYHRTYGMDVLITRCSNNYGPYQFPEKLIPLMISNAMSGMQLPVYGDGLQIRDWLHVSDHCRAIDEVLHRGRPGEVYNIGGNNEKTNIEIVRLIIESTGADEKLIKHVTDRLGHDRRYAIDSSKMQLELGWKPMYEFEDGINETINWYVKNSIWLERVRSKEYMDYYDRMYGRI